LHGTAPSVTCGSRVARAVYYAKYTTTEYADFAYERNNFFVKRGSHEHEPAPIYGP